MAKKTVAPAEPVAEVPPPEFLGPEVLIEYLPIDSLKLWEENPRLNDPAVPEVMKSIREYGFLVPVVVGKDMVVKAGNTRLKAARKLGLKRIPVVRAEHLTEAQLVRFAYADNRLAEIAEWDLKQMSRLIPLEELRSIPGFDKDDYNRIQAFLIKESGAAPEQDSVPEATKTDIQAGDIFTLGDHRLMCGDSTNQKDIDLLMRGEKADMIFTDPPYGVSIGSKQQFLKTVEPSRSSFENIESDTLSPEKLKSVLLEAFKNANLALKDIGAVYVCSPQGGGLGMMMMMMMIEAGLEVRHVLNWVKNSPTFSVGRLDYDYQHEPILFTWKKSHKKVMGGSHKTSCWFIDKPRESKLHPTMKPVAIPENAILNSSEAEDIVLDIFGGAGSTLIASEKTLRKCRMMEISPIYCQVIINRWEAFSGKKATKG